MATLVADKRVRSARNKSPDPKSAVGGRLSPEELVKLLNLLKGSTSVELKVMVPDSQHGLVRLLGFDPVEAEARQTFFFDTPDLKLNKAGLIVRARRFRAGKGDTVVKLRPVDPAMVSADLRRDMAFKIEVDAMPGGYVCSASAKGRASAQDVLDVCDGKVPLDSLFNQRQREFYDAHAPAGLSMNELVVLGPTFLLRLKQQPKGFDRPVNIELWLYPDGSRILELSTKGETSEAFQLAAEFRAFVTSRGITPAAGAATKTGSALAYFSKQQNSKPAR